MVKDYRQTSRSSYNLLPTVWLPAFAVILVLLMLTVAPAVAQTVDDEALDPRGDYRVMLMVAGEGNETGSLPLDSFDITRITIYDRPDAKVVEVETAGPPIIELLNNTEGTRYEITVPIDTNSDGVGWDYGVHIGNLLTRPGSLAYLITGEEGAEPQPLELSVKGNVLRVEVPKSLLGEDAGLRWMLGKVPGSLPQLVAYIYGEQGMTRAMVVDEVLPQPSVNTTVTTTAITLTVTGAENTTTTVTAIPTTSTPGSQDLEDLLQMEPTDPSLNVSLSVNRLEIYKFVEDGATYALLYLEARISAPEAKDLELHALIHLRNGETLPSTLLSLRQMAEVVGTDPAYGVVIRDYDPRNKLGGVLVLQPRAPGDYSEAKLIVIAMGSISDLDPYPDEITNITLVLRASRDTQWREWNLATVDAKPRLINAEPPEQIKEMIEEGKGLPRLPKASTTPTITSVEMNEENSISTQTQHKEEGTIATTAAPTQPPVGQVEEGEGEEKETGHEQGEKRKSPEEVEVEEHTGGGTGTLQVPPTGGSEEREEGEANKAAAEEVEAGKAERGAPGVEKEGGGLPGLSGGEIAVIVVIAALAGVALAFIRKKLG